MTVITIDTLELAQEIESTGLDKKVAEGLARVLIKNQSKVLDDVVTKRDLADTLKEAHLTSAESFVSKKEFATDIKSLDESISSKIEIAKKDAIIILGSVIFTVGVAMTSFISWWISVHSVLPH